MAHLDVKPENILISVQNRAKLTDFDTVLPLGRQVGRMRGTHEYHPPEYFEKSAWYTVGVHGDSWALSLVAYEVLLGGYVCDESCVNISRHSLFLLFDNSRLHSTIAIYGRRSHVTTVSSARNASSYAAQHTFPSRCCAVLC